MNFTVIQNKVADRLNLTSAQALARIADSINERYRWLASSVGFDTIERQVVTANTSIGNQSVVFNCEKVLTVFNPALKPFLVLNEQTFDELRTTPNGTDPAQNYAIQLMGSSTVTIFLDVIPSTVYALNADALVNLITLSGVMVPAFAEDFHDILVYGAMATELDKMEKYDLSAKKEKQFEDRTGQLRLYQAIALHKDIFQGKDQVSDITSFVPLVP